MRLPERTPAWVPWLSLIPALAVLYTQAGYGLAQGFFPDDAMNLVGACRLPWWRVLLDPLWPASGSYRPVGALVYRLIYEASGFHPLPFHLTAFALQTANLAVLWALARRWSGEWPAAMFTAILAAYHVYLSDIYASTGTLYDQLCFFWFFLALYVRPHRRWAFAVCTILAVNSKELGVLLPAAVLLEDLLFTGWRRIDWRSAAIAAVVSAAFLSRSFIVSGEAAQFEAYTPRLEWPRISGNLVNYFGLLFLRPASLNPDQAFTIVGLLAAAGIAARSRAVWFGLGVFALGLGPALLVPMRSLYMLYLPMGGLALALGTALSRASSALPLPEVPRTCAVALVLVSAAVPLHAHFLDSAQTWIRNDGRLISDLSEAMRAALPNPGKGAKLLFERDPFQAEDYLIEMTLPLLYRDLSLDVRRTVRHRELPEREWFDYLLEYDGTHVRVVQSPGSKTHNSGRPELQ